MPIPLSSKHILDSGLTAKGEPRQFVKHSYKDRAREEDGPLSKKDEIILAQYDEDCVGGIFPLKLLIILKILEREGMDHIFSWLPHGRAFGIHKLGLFEEEVMKRFFKQKPDLFFQTQLNLYGFLRLSNGRDSGAYYHELFLRGRPLLSMKMVRTRIKGTKIRASSSPADEPQFYSMPFLGPGARPSAQKSVEERNNSLLMMRGNVGMDLVQNPNVPSCSMMMDNSTQDQLSMLMNRNLLNSYLNSRPSFGNNFNSNSFSMNSFEALYRSLDQGGTI
jgi:Heat shock transcription factor